MLAKSDEFVERTTPAKVTGVVSGKTEKQGIIQRCGLEQIM